MGAPTTPQPPTPVPYKKLLPLATIYFTEAFVFTNIFSYVGYMVLGFKLTDDPDQVGYYAGYIGSTFSVAQFLSSFWWGKISDRFGKRPVLLLGCFGGLISNILFGFSTSLEMAIACRFVSGILNGNIGITRGYTATICDKTNQAKAVGLLQLGLGMGSILGPVVGASLSKPCEVFKMNCSPDDILYKYPYLLPNLFSSVVALVAIAMLLTCLPNDSKIGDFHRSFMKNKYSHINLEEIDKQSLEMTESMDDRLVESNSTGILDRIKNWWTKKLTDKNSILTNRNAMFAALSFAILGAMFTMFDESFPLFAMAKISEGGLGASQADIGIIGAINGVCQVFIQVVIYFPAIKRLGLVRGFRLGLCVGMLIYFNYPTLAKLAPTPKALWPILGVFTFTKVLCGQFAFSCAAALISNSCSLAQVGAINGFAQSMFSLFRAFSPAIAGNMLAWGFRNGLGFPFNQYLVFFTMSAGMGAAFIMAVMLPRSLDCPYVDPATATATKQDEDEDDENENETGTMLKEKSHLISMAATDDENLETEEV